MPNRSIAPHLRGRWPALPVLVAAAVVIAAGSLAAVTRTSTLHARMAAITPGRTILPRTSVEGRYRECAVERPDSAIPNLACARGPAAGGEAAVALGSEAETRLKKGRDADALRTLAELQLQVGDADGSQPARAIPNLLMVLPLTRDSAAVMAELAAAHLLLAGQQQTMENLLEALEWSEWAIELEPHNPQALYNHALALESLTADIAAKHAWTAYLDASTPSRLQMFFGGKDEARFRQEARRHLESLAAMRRVENPPLDASAAELIRFAHEHPQEAREFGWITLLGRWADTLLAGDTATAAVLLRRADVLGAALVARNGDATLHDQVGGIQAHPQRLRDAARAQRIEAEVLHAQREFGPARADSLLEQLSASPVTPSQAARLLIKRARAKLDRRDLPAAKRVLDDAQAKVDTARYPSTAARLHWLRGTLLAQQGEYGRSVAEYRKAEAAYARLGEPLNRAAVDQLIAEVEEKGGDLAATDTWLLRGAMTARPFGVSPARAAVVKGLAFTALHLRLTRAMRVLADEHVAINDSLGAKVFAAEARFTRAMLLAGAGGDQEALQALHAIGSLDQFDDLAARDYMAASDAYVRALATLHRDPAAVLPLAKTLIAYRGQEIWKTRGFALSASAHVTLRDREAAMRDLDSVFVALDHGRDGQGGAAIREMVEVDVRPALLRLVELLAQSDARLALEYLERGSAALSAADVGDTRLRLPIPSGRVVVRPLVLDSTLLVWTVTDDRIDLSVTRTSPRELAEAVDSADTALLHNWEARPHLGRLYQMLIQPLQQRLRTDTEVVFVHDAALSGVPFPALLDGSGHFLVENHASWRAVSVAAASKPTVAAVPDSAAFAAPEFNRAANPGLPRLPHAAQEVADAATAFARVDSGANTPTEFTAALSRYPLVHFAGHAVVNNLRPERSYLVLAKEPGAPSGRLTAEGLEALDLRHLQLVVLSACSTLGGEAGDNGFAGLSGALLGAGAHGVVGSLWKVDDAATRTLMRAFYSEYRGDGNAVRALRGAQLRLLNAKTPLGAWAAFQYVAR
ncbi:MAG TPA: CHAT domain-containing protein [Longimicrobium sp.]|nr:CHAT domain-containing protein [Longimicrobium sp.]